jgi:membrane associated rhomboid family serine protease
MSYTIIILVVTALISIGAFNNRELYNRFILYPYIMSEPREYYRLLSCGFIHADWLHLFFNLFTLYAFGQYVEQTFALMGRPFLYPALYLMAIVASSLPDLVKHKNHSYFRSLGASGGVAAVLFSSVYFYPWAGIRLMFIPIDIPAIVFAILYLAYCVYMSKRGTDNINHNAHFWGSVFGFVFTFLFDPSHGRIFLQQISNLVS